MATHSSVLAWEVPWREEPGGPQSMGHRRAGHDLVAKQQQQSGKFNFTQVGDFKGVNAGWHFSWWLSKATYPSNWPVFSRLVGFPRHLDLC